MATTKRPVANGLQVNDVLTPPEAAAYLRVPVDAVLKAAEVGSLPGRKLGEDWRFSKQALNDWLCSGGYIEYTLQSPLFKDWLVFLEQRFLANGKPDVSPKPGTKEAVLKHFGIFRNDKDLEERLAQLRRFREETA